MFFEWPVSPAIKCFYSELHPEIPVQTIESLLQIKTSKSTEHPDGAFIWDLNYK
jgi:hypothetical protein